MKLTNAQRRSLDYIVRTAGLRPVLDYIAAVLEDRADKGQVLPDIDSADDMRTAAANLREGQF